MDRTPFILKPSKAPYKLSSLSSTFHNAQKTDASLKPTQPSLMAPPLQPTLVNCGHFQANLMSAMSSQEVKTKVQANELPAAFTEAMRESLVNIVDEPRMVNLANNLSETLTIEATIGNGGPHLSNSNSADLLSASPIFNYSPFDTQSLDELATPDEFAPINFIHGLTNINYDFDLSDNSGENSVADDGGGKIMTTLSTINNISASAGAANTKFDLEEFDPLIEKEMKDALSLSIGGTQLNLDQPPPASLIDDSPNDILLQSPLKPIQSDYKGFSSLEIPTISCNTGDFSSLNYQSTTSGPSTTFNK